MVGKILASLVIVLLIASPGLAKVIDASAVVCSSGDSYIFDNIIIDMYDAPGMWNPGLVSIGGVFTPIPLLWTDLGSGYMFDIGGNFVVTKKVGDTLLPESGMIALCGNEESFDDPDPIEVCSDDCIAPWVDRVTDLAVELADVKAALSTLCQKYVELSKESSEAPTTLPKECMPKVY